MVVSGAAEVRVSKTLSAAANIEQVARCPYRKVCFFGGYTCWLRRLWNGETAVLQVERANRR